MLRAPPWATVLLPVPPHFDASALFPDTGRVYSRWILCVNGPMSSRDLITVDPDILGGTPVFRGTRVPVRTLFDYLENNYSLDEFLECFPSVTREMACRLLERSQDAVLTAAA